MLRKIDDSALPFHQRPELSLSLDSSRADLKESKSSWTLKHSIDIETELTQERRKPRIVNFHVRVEEYYHFASRMFRACHSSFYQTLSRFILYQFDFRSEHFAHIFPEWNVKIFEGASIIHKNDFVEKTFRWAIVDRVNASKKRRVDFVVERHDHWHVGQWFEILFCGTPTKRRQSLAITILQTKR